MEKYLQFGVLGLCAIVIGYAFFLLRGEQQRKGDPRPGVIHAVWGLMGFGIVFALLAGGVEAYKFSRQTSGAADQKVIEERLKNCEDNRKRAENDTAEWKNRYLSETRNSTSLSNTVRTAGASNALLAASNKALSLHVGVLNSNLVAVQPVVKSVNPALALEIEKATKERRLVAPDILFKDVRKTVPK